MVGESCVDRKVRRVGARPCRLDRPSPAPYIFLSVGKKSFVCDKRKGVSMSGQTRVSHPLYRLLPTDIEGFDSLAELALDMRWSWNHAADRVWRQLDPE